MNFTTDIYLQDLRINDLYDLEEVIREEKEMVDYYKYCIAMLASATPKDITPKEWQEEPTEWLQNKLKSYFNLIEEYTIKVYKLEILKQYVEDNDIKDLKPLLDE